MNKYQILLLGDGSYPFRTMAWALEYKGFAVKALGNPEEALEALVRKNYDLIVAKFSWADRDNLEVLRRAKKANPATKIILITDRLDMAFPLEAYLIDVDDYIIMPITASEFRRRVRTCLEGAVVELARTPSHTRPLTAAAERLYGSQAHEPAVFAVQL